MATRMQQRRGTAAQWVSTNSGNGPVLEAGEIGFESDTGKFKIGDGTNHWANLEYFLDESQITNITDDYVLSSTLGQVNGVATLDGSGKLTSSQIPTIDELSQDAVNSALIAGIGLDKTYNDGANTITLDIDSTVTTNSGAQTLTNKTISGSDNTITNIANGSLTNSSITINGSPVSLGGSVTIDALPSQTGQNGKYLTTDGSVASWAVVDLSSKADLSGATFTGSVEIDQNLTVDGNLTVNGTTFNVSSTSIVIEDNMVQLAHQNTANTVDLGLVVGYTDGTAKHAGFVRDVSAGKWKLFKDVDDEPATTVNFSQGSLDDLAVNSIELSTALSATNGGTGSVSAPASGNFLYSPSGSTYTPTSLSSTVPLWTGVSVSSNISLSKWVNYFVDTSAARTLTLPSSPSISDEIHIFDSSGLAATNKITVNSNGGKINGTVQNLEIDVNNAGVVLIYTGSNYGWKVG
jgi:hypothetical protein